jgi:hypothetical protein
MRFTFLMALLLGSSAAIAQQPVESSKQTNVNHYFGLSIGYQDKPRLLNGPSTQGKSSPGLDNAFITELSFGKRLVKSLYLEAGLNYTYEVRDWGGRYQSIRNPNISYQNLDYSQKIMLPVGLRYKSNGSTFRVTAAAHMVLGNIANFSTNEDRTYENETVVDRYQNRSVDYFERGGGYLRAHLGLEYQLNNQWHLRLEVPAFATPSRLGRNAWVYTPSIHIGIFKTFIKR